MEKGPAQPPARAAPPPRAARAGTEFTTMRD